MMNHKKITEEIKSAYSCCNVFLNIDEFKIAILRMDIEHSLYFCVTFIHLILVIKNTLIYRTIRGGPIARCLSYCASLCLLRNPPTNCPSPRIVLDDPRTPPSNKIPLKVFIFILFQNKYIHMVESVLAVGTFPLLGLHNVFNGIQWEGIEI